MTATLISGDRRRPGDELDARIKRVAAGLHGLGLGPGDTIGILMRNDFPFFEVNFGAERAGVTAVPMNWHGSSEELIYILKDSEAKAIFAHADLLARIKQHLPARCIPIVIAVPAEIADAYRISSEDCAVPPAMQEYEQWLRAVPSDIPVPVSPVFRLFYTSGSTGNPKGVVRKRGSEEFNERFAREARLALGLEMQPVRAVMTGPLYHSAPLIYGSSCLRHGELLVLQPKFDPNQLLDLIELHHISHMNMVPTMFSRLLGLPEEVRNSFDVSTLRSVTHGGAMCPPETKRAMIDWWGNVITEYYASTETGIIAGCTSQQWLAHPGTVGVPPASVQIKIVGESGEANPPGEVGDIMVRSEVGPLVSYRNQSEATNELKAGGSGEWVMLGDIGYCDVDGFLWICDRRKDLVISGGVNIFPAEVEKGLQSHPAVEDCIVFGIPDNELGEALAAVVELRRDTHITAEQLQAHMRRKLGALRTPKRIQFVARLPREDTGKLSRRKMRDAFFVSVAE